MPALTEILASGKHLKSVRGKSACVVMNKARRLKRPSQNNNPGNSIKCIVDGVCYPSLNAACRATGVGFARLKNVLTKKDWQPLVMEDLFSPKKAKPETKDHLGNAFKTRKDMVFFYAWFYKANKQTIYYRLRAMPLKEALDWPGRPWRQDYVPTYSQRA